MNKKNSWRFTALSMQSGISANNYDIEQQLVQRHKSLCAKLFIAYQTMLYQSGNLFLLNIKIAPANRTAIIPT